MTRRRLPPGFMPAAPSSQPAVKAAVRNNVRTEFSGFGRLSL